MAIEVRLAQIGERPIVRNLMELYQHDFSEIDGSDLDEHGEYGYCDLDCFWIDPGYAAYVIRVDGRWAGFALVNDEVHLQGNTRAIVEFFVVRKYRGRGVGSFAAQTIMDLSPARWEIRVLEKNRPAREFWSSLCGRAWASSHHVTMLNNEHWRGPVFSIDTRRERTHMPANEQLRRIDRYVAAYNAFDIDGMLELLSPDVRFENWSGGSLTAQASGIDAFKRLAEQARAVFSEREQRITSTRQEGDSIVAAIAYRGRLAADIPGGPPAGTVLDLAGESEFAFDGDLIARIVDRS